MRGCLVFIALAVNLRYFKEIGNGSEANGFTSCYEIKEWFGIFFSAFNKGYSNCTNLSAQNNEIAFNEVVNDLNATSMHHCNMDVDRTQKS